MLHTFTSCFKKNYPFFDVRKVQFGYDRGDPKEEFMKWAEKCNLPEDFLSVVRRILTLCQNVHTDLVRPKEHPIMQA